MLEEDRERIKELAKESLEYKWYPIQKGEITTDLDENCSFCEDSRLKSTNHACEKCYLLKYHYDFICAIIWDDMTFNEIEFVVRKLEELAKTGELTI